MLHTHYILTTATGLYVYKYKTRTADHRLNYPCTRCVARWCTTGTTASASHTVLAIHYTCLVLTVYCGGLCFPSSCARTSWPSQPKHSTLADCILHLMPFPPVHWQLTETRHQHWIQTQHLACEYIYTSCLQAVVMHIHTYHVNSDIIQVGNLLANKMQDALQWDILSFSDDELESWCKPYSYSSSNKEYPRGCSAPKFAQPVWCHPKSTVPTAV